MIELHRPERPIKCRRANLQNPRNVALCLPLIQDTQCVLDSFLGRDLSDAYDFEAIKHLCLESVMREAGTQAFLEELGVVPLTITYENFVSEYEATILEVLRYLGLESSHVEVPKPFYDRLADDLTESWVERFKEELQAGWSNKGW